MSDTPDLEFTPDEMHRLAGAVVARAVDHIASLGSQPIVGDIHDTAFFRSLITGPPERPQSMDSLLDLLFDECIPRSYTASSPGYLGYIPGGGVFPAALADFIANTTNRYTGIWQAAPALVQLEANALDWLRDWMGFPETTRGLFTTGGSMATFNAILCARERHLGPEIRLGTLYTSDQAHHCVWKAAKLAGILPDRVRMLPTDDRFMLDPGVLAEAVARDRAAGLRPFAVVSNAGTTNTGAVDPLEAVADVCAAEGLWHHVDGAYGAFFNLCEDGRAVLQGMSRADSLTLDPHKGLFLPYGTGALLVRDGAALRAAHEATTCRRCRTPTSSTTRASTGRNSRAGSPGCGSGWRCSSTDSPPTAPPLPRSGRWRSRPAGGLPHCLASSSMRLLRCRCSRSTSPGRARRGRRKTPPRARSWPRRRRVDA
jgi:aromatic-L-amino-acid decarboxylase